MIMVNKKHFIRRFLAMTTLCYDNRFDDHVYKKHFIRRFLAMTAQLGNKSTGQGDCHENPLDDHGK